MNAIEELTIKIRADKENNAIHITDTGIGEIGGGGTCREGVEETLLLLLLYF